MASGGDLRREGCAGSLGEGSGDTGGKTGTGVAGTPSADAAPDAPGGGGDGGSAGDAGVGGAGVGGAGAEASAQDAESESGPERRCLITRRSFPRETMIRFVLSPDRMIVPDLAARLPGRGFWLSARADVLEPASLRGAFARAAKGPVTFPADLAGAIRSGLQRRVVDTLGFCRRAGQAVAGFAKVREWIETGRAALVIAASDGSEDERRRLLSGAKDVTTAWPLDSALLGAVFGREKAVHVAVAPGRLAGTLMNEIERLAGVSGQVLMNRQVDERRQ